MFKNHASRTFMMECGSCMSKRSVAVIKSVANVNSNA